MKAQESVGFAHWAKINNLKQAAKTLNFLIEHGITHYEQLKGKRDEVITSQDRLLSSIKDKEQRIADIGLLIKYTAALQVERDTLTVEKQKEYGEYQKIRTQAKEMDTIKRNVNSLLSVPKQEEKAHVEQRE